MAEYCEADAAFCWDMMKQYCKVSPHLKKKRQPKPKCNKKLRENRTETEQLWHSHLAAVSFPLRKGESVRAIIVWRSWDDWVGKAEPVMVEMTERGRAIKLKDREEEDNVSLKHALY